jgi:hypothetical protein
MKTPNFFSEVFWRSVDAELPDDEITVLLHLQSGEIWTGFHDAGTWRFVSADSISEPVLHWAPFPEPPEEY